MAMDVGGARGGVKSDINVTPLVDVMLVLLIIMMVIAPLLQKGVQLDLPKATNTTDKPDTSDTLTTVQVDAAGNFYVNAQGVQLSELANRIRGVLEEKKQKIVYLKGDSEAQYGAIMKMMDALREAQVENVALITERPATEKGKK